MHSTDRPQDSDRASSAAKSHRASAYRSGTHAPTLETRPATRGPLRVAIVGGGSMARNHAGAIPRSGVSARVVAYAEPDAEARQAFGDACPGAAAFHSPAEMLAEGDADVVHICTPPASHEALAREALEAGCHVYVEKPFAETRAGAERVLRDAAQRGLKVSAGHQLLFERPMRRALDLLPALGQVEHLESYFSFRPTRTRGKRPLRDEEQLLDVLPHPAYVLLHLLELCEPGGEARPPCVEVGPGGTVHALMARGAISGSLVVSLEARPVESYLRIVGSRGAIQADFVRGTVQQAIGPGSSAIDKSLQPFRLARQLTFGTAAGLFGRVLQRGTSYPGLSEIFGAFYRAIENGEDAPVSEENILETTGLCELVGRRLESPIGVAASTSRPSVLVAGGTGFLGVALVRELLRHGHGVRVLARRVPPPWNRTAGVDYVEADLGESLPLDVLDGIETVVNLAAETQGGVDEHRRNSVEAAERLLRAAATSGATRFLHVSSLAVHVGGGGLPISEQTELEPSAETRGPYVWGKVESERRVRQLAADLGLAATIARPGPIIDSEQLDPPGRLGKRIGNLFFAVGSPKEPFAVVEREFAARALRWFVESPDDVPASINLLSPDLPTRGELVRRLRRSSPGLRAVWIPQPVIRLLSALAVWTQRVLRPGKPPIDLARVFSGERYDTSAAAALAARMRCDSEAVDGSEAAESIR